MSETKLICDAGIIALLEAKIQNTEKKLSIAVTALTNITTPVATGKFQQRVARKALDKIKELENG